MELSILYRGNLSSCNYDCWYCPFAKRDESTRDLVRDRNDLERFVSWLEARAEDRLSVLFTPWGEALVRPWYRAAVVRLSKLPQIGRVAIQTNLSCELEWLEDCELGRLAFWISFHPSQVSRDSFIEKCIRLHRRGVRFSVGIVGLRENGGEAAALRDALPKDVYVWVNAYKDQPLCYTADEIAHFAAIDPHFPINNTRHASLGQSCRTGHTVVSVSGDGTVRRCHFIAKPLGNLYDPGFEHLLMPRPCTNDTCGCFIGYVHLEKLGLDRIFGDGVLERVPSVIRG